MFKDRIFLLEQTSLSRDYIMSVQRKLKQIYPDLNLGKTGPNRDGIDGIFGELTRRAVLRFQRDNGAGPGAKGYPGKWTAGKLGIEFNQGKTDIDNKDQGEKKSEPTQQDCKSFEIFPSLKDTLPKVCKGETKNIGKGADGCSEYVREKTGVWQGNAWHAYKKSGYPKISGFKSTFANKGNLQKMAEVFQKINSQSSGVDPSGINSSGTFDTIKSLMSQSIPSQSSFKNLKLGDVVGIYYPYSQHHGEAFFQAATGKSSDGTQVHAGPYFLVNENGKLRKWTTNDLGKNLKIVPGKSLEQGEHFGFNTHLGFVGAKKPNGEPIVYHSVNGTVLATPLSKMGGTFSLVWARPA